MNALKKQWIKSVIKLTVIGNKPGVLKMHVAKLSELDKKFKVYDKYMIEGLKLLNGVLDIRIYYQENIIAVIYNEKIVAAQKIYKWMQVILDVALDNLEFIEQHDETKAETIIKKLEEVLKYKVQSLNK